MKIAVVGTGISGMMAAWLLQRRHEVTVYEQDGRLGGHTHTVEVTVPSGRYAVDTGFIVYNEQTYPVFTRLLRELDVRTRASKMSFGVSCAKSGVEYGSDSLFAQRGNLFRPGYLKMLLEIPRFNRAAKEFLKSEDDTSSLDEFLIAGAFDEQFKDLYLIPMLAAIWSAPPQNVLSFPARHFFRFLDNHGLIHLRNRPQWRTIEGGSFRYMEKLAASLREPVRLNARAQAVWRIPGGVVVKAEGEQPQVFDEVVVATHSDEALNLLTEPTPLEWEILRAIPYQKNEVILHTDTSLLPRNRRAWSSWNYHRLGGLESRAAVTYNMNILQGIQAPETFCVTLNHADAVAEERILGRFGYSHPLFTTAGLRAQRRHSEISGVSGIHYCGAYWGYGFHEDGVRSALSVCTKLGAAWDGEELLVSRDRPAPALLAG